jgi:nucleotide-binding universal stress UspA family protein
MFGSIVIGLDESDHAKHALATVQALAKATGDRVIVVHVQPLGNYGRGGPIPEEPEEAAKSFVAAVVADLRGDGVDAEGVAIAADTDRIGRALLDLAGQRRAGLVAVGTRGRVGIKALLLGSVAQLVIRESQIPVLVVRDLDA